MIEVMDLSEDEIVAILKRVGYGHLGCCRSDRPYVLPVHYVYDEGQVIIYTTQGKKFEIIRENPSVCLQVEDVVDDRHWESVVAEGVATQLESGPECEHALAKIVSINPTLTPAVSIRWMDDWVRENIEVVYSITITETSGRRSSDRTGNTPFVPVGSSENIV